MNNNRKDGMDMRQEATDDGPAKQASEENGLQMACEDMTQGYEVSLTAYHTDTWRKLSIYVVIPCLVIAGVNAYRLWTEHWEHVAHGPSLEEKPEYPYQNIRTKNYFWGDGDKTLFWNPKVNYHKKDE
jgi:hypothetical protein